ncbi:hypothetical protein QCA50_017326 [Cerrena zonata]|uniref:Protein kinase domain-containing protein n=1 Tax=Cerrena zonata TaxID=2478898 RepID=A0AAW0FSE7_9APHY
MNSTPPTPYNIHHPNTKRPDSYLLTLLDIIQSIPTAFIRVIRGFFPNRLHVTLLRIVLQLPGLHESSPELAEHIARYVAGEQGTFAPSLPQTSGRLAASVGLQTSTIRISRISSPNTSSSSVGSVIPTQLSGDVISSSRFRHVMESTGQSHVSHTSPAPSYQDALERDTLAPPDMLRDRPVDEVSTIYANEQSPPHYSLPPTESSQRSHLEAQEEPVENNVLQLNETMNNILVVSPPPSILIPPPRRKRHQLTPLQLDLHPPTREYVPDESLILRPLEENQISVIDLPRLLELSSQNEFICNVHPPSGTLSIYTEPNNEPLPSPKSPIHETFPSVLHHDGVEYRVRSVIGEGGFARVVAVTTQDNKWFALKILCKYKQFRIFNSQLAMLREKQVMLFADMLDMPFVNKLYASWADKFHTYLLTPLCPKNLVTYIQELPDPLLDSAVFEAKVLRASKELVGVL